MNKAVNSRIRFPLQFIVPTTAVALISVVAVLASGCASAPVGASRVSTRAAYNQIEANALNAGTPSADTVSLLHRYDLDNLAARHPDQAVRELHERAVTTGNRDLLFALAELSYVAGEKIRSSVIAWEPRDARDFYLGSAVYAYLFLFSDGKDAKPDAFDRRFRNACDLYNYGLGWALTERRSTNGVAELRGGKRRLPVGELDLRVDESHFPWPVASIQEFLVADEFKVRGLSVRAREPGLGATLIAVGQINPGLRLRPAAPATVFLRVDASLAGLATNAARGDLELYSGFGEGTVEVGGAKVPLEQDLTVAGAYTLNQSFAWKLHRLQFFSPGGGLKSQLIRSVPYEPGRIPLVFVHGTFSSPVWWAEMVNTLRADPEIRRRYQIWQFLYSSSKPVVVSATELRDTLTDEIAKLDPQNKDRALREMVLVGHSQGGLLCKLAVTDTDDKLWRVFSDKPPEQLNLSTNQLAMIRRYGFFTALPFVKRVVFISTPHRGSFLSGSFARNLVRKLVSVPDLMAKKAQALVHPAEGVKLPSVLAGHKMPTSLDSMSPKNPFLLTLAEIPPAAGIKSHSIIAIDGDEQPPKGDDGVVKYTSAHVDYVESELIVRSFHSCQDKPVTIEEVRRILHEHANSLGQGSKPSIPAGKGGGLKQ